MTRFTRVNGSIAVVVVFLVWVYMQAVILLYGVEFTAAYARSSRPAGCRRRSRAASYASVARSGRHRQDASSPTSTSQPTRASRAPDDRVAEHRHIVGLARGDQVAVFDDRLVDVQAAGVLDVDGNRRPAGERAAAERVGRDQELRTVADGGDRLAGVHGIAREVDHRVAHAHLVGRVAAGNDERVEVLRCAPRRPRGPTSRRRRRACRGTRRPRRADDRDRRAGGSQRLERSGQLAIFEFVFDENRHALAGQTTAIARSQPQVAIADCARCHNRVDESPGARAQPVPAAARQQSGRLVSVGRRGVREGARRRTSRSSCRSATRRATGATSWSTSRSRTTAVAAVLNEHFVSIKVDREERPDVDRVYMTFVQATTGSGGWPMSVWLTPDLKPFYGGTYFPPSSRWGRPGFVDILQEIARVWSDERDKVAQSADARDRAAACGRAGSAAARTCPAPSALDETVAQFRQAFDARHGGFGDAPKFPRPSELLFLLREHARTGDADAREMVLRTLRAMALGGMRDHIGGGFHRYSVDAAWRVPHFEKMLYDQAQLVLAYLEGRAGVRRSRSIAEVAEDTLLYVHARDDRRGRRVLFGRGRRQRAARDAADRPTRTSRKARSISGAPTRSTRCSAPMPRSSSGGSASSRTATRRSIRSRSSPARTCCTSRSRSRICAARPERRPTRSSRC